MTPKDLSVESLPTMRMLFEVRRRARAGEDVAVYGASSDHARALCIALQTIDGHAKRHNRFELAFEGGGRVTFHAVGDKPVRSRQELLERDCAVIYDYYAIEVLRIRAARAQSQD